ncbi:sugar ABC transporter substrate-binding protein [Christensenella intestinihominis]|uniref:sugar ABC transporter substrate-binding protein n=1 Tax=Christensenella intestinihominis TaxID=1851429 RepID=UPI000833C967|nr:sugar ABC transporter substrate-binding protein [Christensenella intestinihominis]
MRKMKRFAFVVVVVMLAGMLFACAPAGTQDSGAPEESAKESIAAVEDTNGDGKIKIGVPVFNLGHTYWVSWVDEIEKLAEEKGFEVISADSKFDAAKQVNLMEDMIAQGCDAIILCPVDPGGVGVVIKEAENAGVRVILSDLDVVDGDGNHVASGLVGIETYETGKLEGKWAADYAKEHFDGKANVAVLSYPAEQPCLDAENGFLEGLKGELGEENVKAVIMNGQAETEKGMTVTENILSANDDINMLWGANVECTLGGVAAMESRGMTQDDAVACAFYTNPDVMELIQADGSMFKVTMHLPPRVMADTAVDMALKAVNGEEFEYEIKVPFELCDKTTVEELMKEE